MGRSLALFLVLAAVGMGCGRDDDGERLRVVLHYPEISRPYMPRPAEVAKQVAGDLEDVGFDVETRGEEWATFLRLTKNAEHQMCIMGWSADLPDIDNFLYVLLDKTNARKGDAQNVSFYESEEAHLLLEEARFTYDEPKRMDLYRRAQELIFRDVPMVPLTHTSQYVARKEAYAPLAPEPITHPVLHRVRTPKDGRLRFVRSSDSVTLDPAQATDGESSNVIEQVYEGLVRFAPGSGEVEPALAESWTHGDEGRVWTFTLREGVRFHDGTALDADAVVNAFERQRDESHRHHRGEFGYYKDNLTFVERVERGASGREVVFRCRRRAPPFFLSILAVFAFGIPSPAAMDKWGDDFGRHPVGTGPFRFVDWRVGAKEIVLERNDGYWGGPAALKEVLFQVSPDATARSLRLIAGDADAIDNITLETLGRLRGTPGIVVEERPGLNFCYLAMNTQKAPFDDPRLREAVALAIDKQRIIQAAYDGQAQPAVNPVPPTIPGWHGGLKDRVRDVERARRLLRERLAAPE